jgi:hypothetical protein
LSEAVPSLGLRSGEEHLNAEAEFAYAVDVRRAREVLRPLPSRSSQVDEQNVPIAKAETPIVEDVPQLPPLDPPLSLYVTM